MPAPQGCWTCKRRKIGCDRQLPSCNNCTRTKRLCQGYGLRVHWPDHPDGRRRNAQTLAHVPTPDAQTHQHYGRFFLNFVSDDVTVSTDAHIARLQYVAQPGPLKSLTVHPLMAELDGVLLSYYELIISALVSTIHIGNGFCAELLPMALSHSGPSAASLVNAMLSVAAFHYGDAHAAVAYKINALRSLSDSLKHTHRPCVFEETKTQVAACMMLCVYSVFDETDGNWVVHLDGAKQIVQTLYSNYLQRMQPDFLLSWFLYHEVLGCFTQPLRETGLGFELLSLFQGSRCDVTHIIGSLGCSIEVMEILHFVTKLRADSCHTTAGVIPAELIQERGRLEARLHSLTQRHNAQEETLDVPRSRTHILAIAELYRVATIIYLQRVCPLESDEQLRAVYLAQAFDILGALDITTCPWPLFVIACESVSDSHRIQILQALQRMEDVRKIGNVHVMRTIIEDFWKQQDLRVNTNVAQPMNWWDRVYSHTAVPWFI